jgi:hypothetical protein
MISRPRVLATGLAILCLSGFVSAEPAPLTPEQLAAATRTDDFSIPTPGEFMAALNKTGKPDWSSKTRGSIPTNFTSRAQLALNMGTLIADGYIAVEAETKQSLKNVGRDIKDIAKPLGVQSEIIERGKSLEEFADAGQWNVLREELEATGNEVKLKMAEGSDKDLIALVTVGAWLRGLEVVSSLVVDKYSAPSAKLLRQPGVVTFLKDKLESLPEKLRDDPAVKRTRVKLIELQKAVSFAPEETPTLEAVKQINKLASEVVKEIASKKLQ